MPFLVDSPVSVTGADTPGEKQHATDVLLREDAAAERRRVIAQTAATTTGGISAKRAAIRVLIEQAGVITGPVPSPNTIRSLERRWKAGKRSTSDYRAGKRTGRPPLPLESRIQTIITNTAQTTPKMPVRQLHRAIKKFCRKHGLKPPAYGTVQDRFLAAANGNAGLAGMTHGSRAAQMDAMPRSTWNIAHTHDLWVIDEFTAPVNVKLYDDDRWVSTLVDVICIKDYKSKAIISWIIADPGRRRDAATGKRKRGGFDQDDVLGALVSAACRELASFGAHHFAGYLPKAIRWDNAAGHRALMQTLGTGTNGKPGLHIENGVTKTCSRRPDRNGSAESLMGMMKSLLQGTLGHVDLHVPSDDTTVARGVSPKSVRTAAAATSRRAAYQDPVAVEDLLTVAQLAGPVGAAVNAYNTEHIHSAHGLTPREAYHEFLPSRLTLRKGRDILAILDATTVQMAKGGVVAGRWGRPHRFAWQFDGLQFTLDRSVTLRIDPLARGIFARVHGRDVFLPNLEEWAKGRNALDYARSMTATAQLLTAPTRHAREEFLHEVIGADGVSRSKLLAAALSNREVLDDDAVVFQPSTFALRDDLPVAAEGDPASSAPPGADPGDERAPQPDFRSLLGDPND